MKVVKVEMTEDQRKRIEKSAETIMQTIAEITRSNLRGTNMPVMVHKGLMAELMLEIIGYMANHMIERINVALEKAVTEVEK